MRKRIVLVGMMAVMALGITACSSKAEETVAVETEVESTVATETEEVSKEESDSSLNAADSSDIYENFTKEDVAAFAELIQEAFADKNLDLLFPLFNYPAFITTVSGEEVEVTTEEEILALDPSEVFGEALLEVIANIDTTQLSAVEAGIMMGDGMANVIFGQNESNGLGIISIYQ